MSLIDHSQVELERALRRGRTPLLDRPRAVVVPIVEVTPDRAELSRLKRELQIEQAKLDSVIRLRTEIEQELYQCPHVTDIIREVCKYYRVSKNDLIGGSHSVRVMRPRHVTYYLAKTLTLLSFPQIGRIIGGRDHTTIQHGVRKIERLMPFEPQLAFDIATLGTALRQENADV